VKQVYALFVVSWVGKHFFIGGECRCQIRLKDDCPNATTVSATFSNGQKSTISSHFAHRPVDRYRYIAMAAILCESIGHLCSGLSTCCTVPCTYCCHGLSHVLCSPFAPYLIVTLSLNIPSTIWGMKALLLQSNDCSTNQENLRSMNWLIFNGVATLIHIVAAFYIVYQIQSDRRTTPQASDNVENHHHHVDSNIHDGSNHATAATTTTATNYSHLERDTTPSINNINPTSNHTSRSQHQQQQRASSSSSSLPEFLPLFLLNMIHPTEKGTKTDDGHSKATTTAPNSYNSNNNSTNDSSNNYYKTIDDQHHDHDDLGHATSLQRFQRVLCYDIVVAIYIVISVVWIIGQSVGISTFIVNASNTNDDGDNYVNNDASCENLSLWVILSLVTGYLYLSMVCIAFACSFFCLR
jgi:hypothetical protein